jgi:NADH:ubiquinone oxidoreductase subunit 5 (subunit L)/multisubunit Na+/H+ antiporter MnhA subunit
MNDRITFCLTIIPALPLLAAVVVAVLGPKLLKAYSHVPVVLALAGACVASLVLVGEVSREQASVTVRQAGQGFEQVVTYWTWAAVPDALAAPTESASAEETAAAPPRTFRIDIALRADALTAMMLGMVTFVATLVAIFAAGYMEGDRSYWRFFATVGLFVFSMTMLVSVSNFLLLFVFWEAVGVCSYLLIGFWYEKPEAAAAGKKAFLVNRVGDFAFTLAMFLIWCTYGTLNYHDSLASGETDPEAIQFAAADPGSGDLVAGVLGQSFGSRPGTTSPAAWRRPFACSAPGSVRQERPVPAARLAARCDGRAHARQRPDSRRDDGHRRRLHGGPLHAVVLPCRPRRSSWSLASAASRPCWPGSSP